MSDEDQISGRRFRILEDVILGPPGKPEESLIVQVESITKSVKMLGKFIWTMGMLGGSLIIKEIFQIITNAS
jgi:hypothetical protein